MSSDIAEIEAKNIFEHLKKRDKRLYNALKQSIDMIFRGSIKDKKIIWHKRRILTMLKEAVEFYCIDNPLPNGQPDPRWVKISDEIRNLLMRLEPY